MYNNLRWALLWMGAALNFCSFICEAGLDSKLTPIERAFQLESERKLRYPNEKIQVIETKNHLSLGKLAALSLIDWMHHHPKGVVALSIGKTSRSFMHHLKFYKQHWNTPEIQAELQRYGLFGRSFPKTQGLKFIQAAEFYPILPDHPLSVRNNFQKNFLNVLEISDQQVLSIDFNQGILKEKGGGIIFREAKVDLSLLAREPRSRWEEWQKQALREALLYCEAYEAKIRAWGGIDLFLGSLEMNGELGYNLPGSSFNGETHLEALPYAPATQGADDFGRMRYTKNKVMMTLGLKTITAKSNADFIVLAEGTVNAPWIRAAVEDPLNQNLPLSLLQRFSKARLYVTRDAAKGLNVRRDEDIERALNSESMIQVLKEIAIEIALKEKTPLILISKAQLQKYSRGQKLLKKLGSHWISFMAQLHGELVENLQEGLQENTQALNFVHLASHYNDLLFSYYPMLPLLPKDHQHQFVYVHDGYPSVSDHHLEQALQSVNEGWLNRAEADIFKNPYKALLKRFKKAYESQNVSSLERVESNILLQQLCFAFGLQNISDLKRIIRWLKDDYFPNKVLGSDDSLEMQKLKTIVRESEADRLWFLKGFDLRSITHLRVRFGMNHLQRQVEAIENIERVWTQMNPDVVMVMDDPIDADAGLDYKILQFVGESLKSKKLKKGISLWGYRSVGHPYGLHEANLLVPASEAALNDQQRVFQTCFASQRSKNCALPYLEQDFLSSSRKLQDDQLQALKILLGNSFFETHPDARIREAKGLILIRKMSLNRFLRQVQSLREGAEFVPLELEF